MTTEFVVRVLFVVRPCALAGFLVGRGATPETLAWASCDSVAPSPRANGTKSSAQQPPRRHL